ncbi:MAG: type II toxin-antitoxin system RelE/ParE family toxin [Candidatus Dormibacteraceae bacterium]
MRTRAAANRCVNGLSTSSRQMTGERWVLPCARSFSSKASRYAARGSGRQLGGGLFEFRLRDRPLLARVFCHAYGDRVVLLLAGYDKGRDPSSRRQEREIALARSRLSDWHSRQRR